MSVAKQKTEMLGVLLLFNDCWEVVKNEKFKTLSLFYAFQHGEDIIKWINHAEDKKSLDYMNRHAARFATRVKPVDWRGYPKIDQLFLTSKIVNVLFQGGWQVDRLTPECLKWVESIMAVNTRLLLDLTDRPSMKYALERERVFGAARAESLYFRR